MENKSSLGVVGEGTEGWKRGSVGSMGSGRSTSESSEETEGMLFTPRSSESQSEERILCSVTQLTLNVAFSCFDENGQSLLLSPTSYCADSSPHQTACKNLPSSTPVSRSTTPLKKDIGCDVYRIEVSLAICTGRDLRTPGD